MTNNQGSRIPDDRIPKKKPIDDATEWEIFPRAREVRVCEKGFGLSGDGKGLAECEEMRRVRICDHVPSVAQLTTPCVSC